MPNSLYLDLVIRLDIMLSDFSGKTETCLDYKKKNQNFLNCKKSAFPKGLTHAFGQKMPIFSLFRFGQNKTRNNA